MKSKLHYVLCLVIDPAHGFVVGLTKKRGPEFLINKVTFPGGKLEASEDVLSGASREMLEETGLAIPAKSWTVFGEEYHSNGDYTLTKLVTKSSKVLHARTMESEPVWLLSISRHLQYAANQPNQYSPDFITTLKAALDAIDYYGLEETELTKEAA